jgi:hypothetical protein
MTQKISWTILAERPFLIPIPTPPLLFLSLLFYISFIHPISLLSSFGISPHSFVFVCLSLLIAHSAPSFLSVDPVFSLFVPTSGSRHHFSLSSGTPVFPLSYTFHTPCCTLILWFSPSFLACPCLCSFHSAPDSSIFLLLLIFPFLHWHIHTSGSTSFSPSSPCSFSFFSSIPSVSCTLPFHPFCLQTFKPSFTLSLSLLHSSLILFLPFPYFCPVH